MVLGQTYSQTFTKRNLGKRCIFLIFPSDYESAGGLATKKNLQTVLVSSSQFHSAAKLPYKPGRKSSQEDGAERCTRHATAPFTQLGTGGWFWRRWSVETFHKGSTEGSTYLQNSCIRVFPSKWKAFPCLLHLLSLVWH